MPCCDQLGVHCTHLEKVSGSADRPAVSHPCRCLACQDQLAAIQLSAGSMKQWAHVVSGVLALQVGGHGLACQGAQEQLTVGAVELCGSAHHLALALRGDAP